MTGSNGQSLFMPAELNINMLTDDQTRDDRDGWFDMNELADMLCNVGLKISCSRLRRIIPQEIPTQLYGHTRYRQWNPVYQWFREYRHGPEHSTKPEIIASPPHRDHGLIAVTRGELTQYWIVSDEGKLRIWPL